MGATQSGFKYPKVSRVQIYNDLTGKDYGMCTRSCPENVHKIPNDFQKDWPKHGYKSFKLAPYTKVRFSDEVKPDKDAIGNVILEKSNDTNEIKDYKFSDDVVGRVRYFDISNSHDLGSNLVKLIYGSSKLSAKKFTEGSHNYDGNFPNDAVTKVLVGGKTEVDLFKDSKFRGTKWTITNNKPYAILKEEGPWVNQISSIKVRNIGNPINLKQITPSGAFLTSQEEQEILDERQRAEEQQQQQTLQQEEAAAREQQQYYDELAQQQADQVAQQQQDQGTTDPTTYHTTYPNTGPPTDPTTDPTTGPPYQPPVQQYPTVQQQASPQTSGDSGSITVSVVISVIICILILGGFGFYFWRRNR